MKDILIEYDSMILLEYGRLFVDKHQSFYLFLLSNEDDDSDGVIMSHEDKIIYNEFDVLIVLYGDTHKF